MLRDAQKWMNVSIHKPANFNNHKKVKEFIDTDIAPPQGHHDKHRANHATQPAQHDNPQDGAPKQEGVAQPEVRRDPQTAIAVKHNDTPQETVASRPRRATARKKLKR